MDLQLLVLVTVVEEKNFTRAAQKLHISQPAISQHIQNLEQRLQVKLLERTNKYVRLNQAGEIAYRHAKEVLKLYGQMERLIDDLKESPSGPLKIGSSFTFGEYILPHLIADFRTQYPDIQPTILVENTQHVLDSIARGDIDIGIIEGIAVHDSDILVEAFAKDMMVIVASTDHPLASKSSVTAQDLEQEQWIVRELGSGTREFTDYTLQSYDITPSRLVEYASTQIIKESVAAGLGLTVLSRWTIRREVEWHMLTEVKPGKQPLEREFALVFRNSEFQTKAMQLFRAFVHHQADKLEPTQSFRV